MTQPPPPSPPPPGEGPYPQQPGYGSYPQQPWGPYPPPRRKSKAPWIILGVLGGTIFLCCGGCLAVVGLGSLGTGEIENTSASDVAGDKGEDLGYPADERDFLGIVGDAQDAAEDANEMEIVDIREGRDQDLCALLSDDLKVSDWVGEVEDVETEGGGDSGVLSLFIAKDVNVATWNNSVSDTGDDTLIDVGSDLWDSVKKLEEGDRVEFSGQFLSDDGCVRESSVMDENGVLTPTFIFRFDDVDRVED